MFDYSEIELENALTGYFSSVEPLRLRNFPSKQKRKYLVLLHIVTIFDDKRHYHESEINELLYDIYPDFVTLRRALVDYRLMSRTKDGSEYWINKKKT